jgi:hypothetical protein
MQIHQIEIAGDTTEAEQFCQYLKSLGHDARVGKSTGNYVDGAWTSSDANAQEIMNNLWNEYCNGR